MDEETGLITEIRRFVVCVRSASGPLLGTGILVGPTTVLTCRHVLQDGERARQAEELSLVFFGREGDARRARRVTTRSTGRSYPDDVALIEIAEPFAAGERIPAWDTAFPATGAEVVFAGYRQRMKSQANPELVSTQTGYFEPGRGCHMLMDGCTQGFSGGPVVRRHLGQWQVVGMVVANLQDRPSRTWCLPAEAVAQAIAGLGHPGCLKTARTLRPGDARAACFRYLDGLKARHNPLGVFIDLGAQSICPTAQPVGSAAGKILELVAESEHAAQRTFFFGHYGSGKTCVAVEGASRALAACDPALEVGKIPIYVELRDWKALPGWTDVARHIAESDRYPISSVAEVLELARRDRLFFLLDGLDELAGSLSAHGSLGLMQEIPRSLCENASFIAFSRFSFFLDRRNLMEMMEDAHYPLPEALMERLSASRYRAYAILPPRESDIRQYLREACQEDAEDALRIVHDVYNLADLARRPVMLTMIARSVPALRAEMPALTRHGGTQIRSADLYEVYVSGWLRNPKHRSGLSQRQRRRLIEDLALSMWDRQSLRVRHQELASFLTGRTDEGSLEPLMYDIGNCSFLDLAVDGYEFSHKSFLEYFVASAICRDLFDKDRFGFDNELLLSVCMRHSPAQNEITGFLRDLVARQLQARPEAVALLAGYFDSPFGDDRAWAGYLLGYAAVDLRDDTLVDRLVTAYHTEGDAWVKRSLALACGRAGRADIVQSYATELLPLPEHRLVNLKYHMEYYGALRRVVEAVVSHLLSPRHTYLRLIDVFTLQQVMNCEEPLRQSDMPVARALSELLRGRGRSGEPADTAREIGLAAVLAAVDEAMSGAD